ncbi:MAG: dihydropyrimidinase [Caldilineae bacterium]|nr:MAG: dihydropyrimidinase [Caldilineae bacterium]
MEFDLVIKNGTIVTAEATVQADVGIRGERIAAVGEGLSGRRELDAAGKLVTPGAIDGHVHLEMPIGNFVSADDFFTGTRAAAFGGTTAIVDFVETAPDETMLDALAARRAKAEGRAVIDYGLHMTIGPTDISKLGQLPAVFEAGCGTFKLYMAYGLRLRDDELLQAFEAIREVGGLPVVHAENWDVICALVARHRAAGHTEPRWHPRSRPAVMEAEAAGRVIDLATLAGVPVHIFHVSCPPVVERIAAARRRGLPVTGETCPQYLLLDDSVFEQPGVAGALPVCAPPIRPAGNQDPLWEALAANDLQIVTTDHCPFTREDKATGLGDFSRIPGGVPAIEARFPLLYTFGVRAGHFSANRWVDIACTTPARLFGFARKGHIAPGYDADLVIFDPQREVTLSPRTLHEKPDWTPYDGLTVTGWPEVTLSRGEVIVQDGEFLGAAGRGRFVKRKPVV